ncbi:MAG TPA: hypothetical protein V6C88_12435, partial [Chroococcidiopsis sp.]
FGWTMVISSVLGMTMLLLVTHANRSLGIDDHWFSLGDSLILTVMGQIAYMPVLVLAARLCPTGVEATLFALLMSVTNFAGLVSYELGAGLMHWLNVSDTNFDRLWLLVLITNLTTLLPLPLLGWLPGQVDDDPLPMSSVAPEELPTDLPTGLPTNLPTELSTNLPASSAAPPPEVATPLNLPSQPEPEFIATEGNSAPG